MENLPHQGNMVTLFNVIKLDGAIIHESKGKWYITLYLRKNVFTEKYCTCGNGIVREPKPRKNMCSKPKTWNTKEEAMEFLEKVVNANA